RNTAERSNILKLETAATRLREPVQITASVGMDVDPDYSPDGARIAFSSDRSGSREIWVADRDGSNPYPVTSFGGASAGSPRWSPDGTQIAFDASPGGQDTVFAVGASGGQPRRVFSPGLIPAWSHDGQWIYFLNRSAEKQIWKVRVAGGTAVQVTRNGGFE